MTGGVAIVTGANRGIDAHLTGTFRTCRMVAPRLVARGGGAIVNTSLFAFLGDYSGTGHPAGRAR